VFLLFTIAGIGGGKSSSSALYCAIAALNSVLLILAVFSGSDFVVWFVLFEISVITGIPTLVIEGRSYRRIFALVVMLFVTFVGSVGVYFGIHNHISTVFTSNNATVPASGGPLVTS
jgi:formate hydrogenlyase subunit 3/multisubunit Na+/H+ antiporter MnhD subunit